MPLTYLVKIESTELPKIKSYAVAPEQIFSEGERTVGGQLKNTFVGIVYKLFLEFAPLTKEEMSDILAELRSPRFSVSFWDPDTQAYLETDFYRGSFQVGILKKSTQLYNGFSVNLIAYDPI